MIRITYASGKEYVCDYAWNKLAPKLQLGGLRMFSPVPGKVLIPLNSNTIAMIEQFGEEEEEKEQIIAEETKSSDEVVEDSEPEEQEEPKKESIQEKKDKILAEMKLKSECPHEEYQLYYQEIMSGPKNNRALQMRYFPVCKVCGVRERYVKNDTLSEEDKANAVKWDK